MEIDCLVGLRFELNGGVGRMAGIVIGKAGSLYLVQRDGVDYSELLEISDLRSARFYRTGGRPSVASGTTSVATPSSGGRLSDKIRRSASGEEG